MVIFFVFWQYCLLSLLGTLRKHSGSAISDSIVLDFTSQYLMRIKLDPNRYLLTFHYLDVFKETEYWSVENIELGISALLVCFEMVIFAILHMYSFSYVEYVVEGVSTPVRKSLRDGFNPIDLFREVGWGFQDIYLIIRGRPLPTREGHLSGTLKRANTRRQKNRLFFKSRKGSSFGSVDPSMETVDESTLEAGGKFLPELPASQDTAVQAPLLSRVDGRNAAYPFTSPGTGHESYEMSATRRSDHNGHSSPNSSLTLPPPPEQNQQQHQQIQMQQIQQQQQQQMLQQQQQQQQYASRPADYQY